MNITKKRIRSSDAYLSHIPPDQEFKVTANVSHMSDAALQKLGFRLPPTDGDTVLPRGIGPISRFNADGSFRIRRDLPKEYRYTHTVQWTRRQWTGGGSFEEVTDFRDVGRDCYPREPIEPPSLELTLVIQTTGRFIVTQSFTRNADSDATRTHAINLMLELFKSCDITNTGLVAFQPPAIQRVNWKFFPIGERPWEHLQTHLQTALRNLSPKTSAVIWDRQVTVEGHGPEEIGIGVGGFDDYIAYIFKSAGLVVLESIRKDNALYIFDKNWKQLSQLTKAEIIRDGLCKERIIHSQGWKKKLTMALNPPRSTPPPLGSASARTPRVPMPPSTPSNSGAPNQSP